MKMAYFKPEVKQIYLLDGDPVCEKRRVKMYTVFYQAGVAFVF